MAYRILAPKLTAFPGCPTLTWMIANRVCNPYEESDAFISFTGRKGSSKTTSSTAFCENLAVDIAHMRGKGEPPEKFFNIDHVRSITETGAIELLSSGILKNENFIFLLDDTGTQWSARNFQSQINKLLNSILQICRVYKCVIVANFIMANHVDVQARQMTDFRAVMQFKNTRNQQAIFKFFYIEQGENGKEYKKFLTWHKKRIVRWVIGRPSPELESQIKSIRRGNTDEFIANAEVMMAEIMDKKERQKEGKTGKRNFKSNPEYDILRAKVVDMQQDPTLTKRQKTATAIAKHLKTTRYKVEMAGDF